MLFIAVWKRVMGPEELVQHQFRIYRVVEECTEVIRDAITDLHRRL
jgi:hypothetical protein